MSLFPYLGCPLLRFPPSHPVPPRHDIDAAFFPASFLPFHFSHFPSLSLRTSVLVERHTFLSRYPPFYNWHCVPVLLSVRSFKVRLSLSNNIILTIHKRDTSSCESGHLEGVDPRREVHVFFPLLIPFFFFFPFTANWDNFLSRDHSRYRGGSPRI